MPYCLGIDCAIKTFAFSFSQIDLSTHAADTKSLLQLIEEIDNGGDVKNAIIKATEINERTKNYCTILGGDVIDLTGGEKMDMVDRIRALTHYCRAHILPLFPPGEKINVYIEFQMGQNPDARVIMSSVVTLFIDHNIFIVPPSLKNKIYFTEDGKLSNFIVKYASQYSANKAHTAFNFKYVLTNFKCSLPGIKAAKLNHIADSFIQIIGMLVFPRRAP